MKYWWTKIINCEKLSRKAHWRVKLCWISTRWRCWRTERLEWQFCSVTYSWRSSILTNLGHLLHAMEAQLFFHKKLGKRDITSLWRYNFTQHSHWTAPQSTKGSRSPSWGLDFEDARSSEEGKSSPEKHDFFLNMSLKKGSTLFAPSNHLVLPKEIKIQKYHNHSKGVPYCTYNAMINHNKPFLDSSNPSILSYATIYQLQETKYQWFLTYSLLYIHHNPHHRHLCWLQETRNVAILDLLPSPLLLVASHL